MLVSMKDNEVIVERPSEENEHKALHGLTRTLVANMVEGVTTGFSKQLEIIGVGYKAEVRPYGLQLSLGFSHVIEYKAPVGDQAVGSAADAGHHRGREQGNGRAGRRGDSQLPSAGAIQGEGHQVRRRAGTSQSRQGGGQVNESHS